MDVLVFGDNSERKRFTNRFPDTNVTHVEVGYELPASRPDCIFWFNPEEEPEHISDLAQYECPIFLNLVTGTVSEFVSVHGVEMELVYGFCGLPTLFERDILEVSAMEDANLEELQTVLSKLGTQYEIVSDRVGMVTPRTLFMVINEAYHALTEGVATKDAIDEAMKLGTNYPYGPFEWCKRIGINHVHDTLEALLFHTGDARYRMSDALKREYLKMVNQ